MKVKYLIIITIIFILGCDSEEFSIPTEENVSLIINWEHEQYGNSGEGRNAEIYLYESEEDYNIPFGNAITCQNITEEVLWSPETVYMVHTAHFNNLKPINYWVRIFNADNYEQFVEHNQESFFTFQYPLVENAVTTVQIPTKRVYIKSYDFQKIEIYDFPDEIISGNNEQVELSFIGISKDIFIDTLDFQILNIENSMIQYEPKNITINKFNARDGDPEYYISIRKPGSSAETNYKIRIFDLLNSNARLDNEYFKLNSTNEIEYILYVSWNFE